MSLGSISTCSGAPRLLLSSQASPRFAHYLTAMAGARTLSIESNLAQMSPAAATQPGGPFTQALRSNSPGPPQDGGDGQSQGSELPRSPHSVLTVKGENSLAQGNPRFAHHLGAVPGARAPSTESDLAKMPTAATTLPLRGLSTQAPRSNSHLRTLKRKFNHLTKVCEIFFDLTSFSILSLTP